MRRIFHLILCIGFVTAPAVAQEDGEYGNILNVSGKTVTVQFEQRDINVGDEIEFWRFKFIVDPVSGNERGSVKNLVGKGVVDEIGLGKAYITLTVQVGPYRVNKSDRALPTGAKKKMTRKVGRIQEITADKKEMVIDLGSEDEISEGDNFLIQRTENIYDTKTNRVTGSNQIDVGRGKVSAVKNRTSTATVTRLMPGMEVQKTDTVVFTPESRETPPSPGELVNLRAELDSLKGEVAVLKAAVDSLGNDQRLNRKEFTGLKKEFESILPRLRAGDIKGSRIVTKHAETVILDDAKDIFARYRRAPNECLGHRFPAAIEVFNDIIRGYPDSPLVENCRYWIAQSDFNSGDYQAAAKGFQAVLADTRFTHKDDDASIMLGITYVHMEMPKDALEQFQRFITSYPESEYRGKVEHWIERLSTLKTRG